MNLNKKAILILAGLIFALQFYNIHLVEGSGLAGMLVGIGVISIVSSLVINVVFELVRKLVRI